MSWSSLLHSGGKGLSGKNKEMPNLEAVAAAASKSKNRSAVLFGHGRRRRNARDSTQCISSSSDFLSLMSTADAQSGKAAAVVGDN